MVVHGVNGCMVSYAEALTAESEVASEKKVKASAPRGGALGLIG